MLNEIKFQARQAALELIEAAKLKCGDIIVIGCSSSEIVGERIGKGSSMAAAEAVFEGLYPVIKERGLFLAAQCCEHLNRAIIIEKALAEKLNAVSLVIETKVSASGVIYGSVNGLQIADELQKLGYNVDRKIIAVKDVKEVGDYVAVVKLHKEVQAQVAFKVIAEGALTPAVEAAPAEEAAAE